MMRPNYVRRRLGVVLAAGTVLLSTVAGVPQAVWRAADDHSIIDPVPEAGASESTPPDVRLDVMLLRRIGGCESSGSPMGELRWDAPNNYGSSASGAFQIIDSTWRGWIARYRPDLIGVYNRALDAPREVQIEVALAALNEHGGNRRSTWAASYHCWRSR